MIMRPVDENSDVLPILSSLDSVKGAQAVALLVRDRLDLLAGEWWENPKKGNSILEMLQDSRLTEADQQALATYLSSYIRETDGVQEVRDVAFSIQGRRFSFSCTVETDNGSATINYEL